MSDSDSDSSSNDGPSPPLVGREPSFREIYIPTEVQTLHVCDVEGPEHDCCCFYHDAFVREEKDLAIYDDHIFRLDDAKADVKEKLAQDTKVTHSPAFDALFPTADFDNFLLLTLALLCSFALQQHATTQESLRVQVAKSYARLILVGYSPEKMASGRKGRRSSADGSSLNVSMNLSQNISDFDKRMMRLERREKRAETPKEAKQLAERTSATSFYHRPKRMNEKDKVYFENIYWFTLHLAFEAFFPSYHRMLLPEINTLFRSDLFYDPPPPPPPAYKHDPVAMYKRVMSGETRTFVTSMLRRGHFEKYSEEDEFRRQQMKERAPKRTRGRKRITQFVRSPLMSSIAATTQVKIERLLRSAQHSHGLVRATKSIPEVNTYDRMDYQGLRRGNDAEFWEEFFETNYAETDLSFQDLVKEDDIRDCLMYVNRHAPPSLSQLTHPERHHATRLGQPLGGDLRSNEESLTNLPMV